MLYEGSRTSAKVALVPQSQLPTTGATDYSVLAFVPSWG